LATLLFVSFAPALALLAFIYMRDVYEPEPRALVMRFYIAGALLVVPVALAQIALGEVLSRDIVVQSFVATGLTEELAKFLLCRVFVFGHFQFNEHMDGIVYCSAVSLGFASMENLFYVASGGLSAGIVRALLPVPGHALFGVLMGYYMGKAKFGEAMVSTNNMVKALFVPAIFHGIFNYLLMVRPAIAAMVVPLMICLWIYCARRVRLALEDSPFRTSGTGMGA